MIELFKILIENKIDEYFLFKASDGYLFYPKWIKRVNHYFKYDIYKKNIMIIENFWVFRKEIANFRRFDYYYNFDLFVKSLKETRNYIRDCGHMIDSQKHNIVASMNAVIILIERLLNNNNYYDWAERLVGDNYSDKYFEKIKELENKDLKEMGKLIQKFQYWWD